MEKGNDCSSGKKRGSPPQCNVDYSSTPSHPNLSSVPLQTISGRCNRGEEGEVGLSCRKPPHLMNLYKFLNLSNPGQPKVWAGPLFAAALHASRSAYHRWSLPTRLTGFINRSLSRTTFHLPPIAYISSHHVLGSAGAGTLDTDAGSRATGNSRESIVIRVQSARRGQQGSSGTRTGAPHPVSRSLYPSPLTFGGHAYLEACPFCSSF